MPHPQTIGSSPATGLRLFRPNHTDSSLPPAPPALPTEQPSTYWLLGGACYRVRIWTEAQWAALPARSRPTGARQTPGVGWVLVAAQSEPPGSWPAAWDQPLPR